VAQAKPWMQVSRGTKGTALYSSSTLALRPDDGTLAWYFQHVQGETLDMDEVYERVLVDIGDRKTLFTIGKAGILWKLDRKSGEFIDAQETIFQNISISIMRPANWRTVLTFWSRKSASGRPCAPAPKAATTGRP